MGLTRQYIKILFKCSTALNYPVDDDTITAHYKYFTGDGIYIF
jgi:hypothetical protein